ncbi:MAG: type II secretion system protein [Candidatus Wallbacteria bacterium]|nr:type II secretion system protein [Candidatus Wallbacteria bacterium]
MRRGVTLVELVVAIALFSLCLVVVWTQMRQSTQVEGKSSREAQFAMQQALLFDQLTFDLRSSVALTVDGPSRYRIQRLVETDTGPVSVEVVYDVDKDRSRVTRTLAGAAPQAFDFFELLPERVQFRLDIEKLANP